ncbi:MAG: hypothetical protein B6D41_19775 [Chloroflexi bacterium UTCFX4]|nr:MAG: hypothetical protein B6D41_19775 [Chloroflexi bacterium UTCFX4]
MPRQAYGKFEIYRAFSGGIELLRVNYSARARLNECLDSCIIYSRYAYALKNSARTYGKFQICPTTA